LACAYFVSGWLGLKMPYTGSHITLVWLPTGIAVAALLRGGMRMWPGVYAGAFFVNLSIGSPWALAAAIAVGNTLAPFSTAYLLKRIGFDAGFGSRRDVRLFAAGAGAGMIVSASCGVISLVLTGFLPAASMHSAWLSWWMGDTVGVLLGAPFLLAVSRESAAQLWRDRKAVLSWLLIALPVAWLAFVGTYTQFGQNLPLAFLTLPLFAWAGLRFGNLGATFASLTFSVVAAWRTANGHGTFSMNDSHAGLFLLWSYMTIIALTGLLITALQAERAQAERSLRESEEKLRGLFELSPLGIALTDMKGRYIEFNNAFRNICGYSDTELNALDYWTLTPKKYAADEARQLESLQRIGRYGPYEKEYVRKDGSLIPLRLNGMLLTRGNGEQYIWSIVEDITDRKRIDADLRIAATAFEAQVGIIVTDAQGVILKVNRTIVEETGYAAEELMGKTPRVLKSGRHDEAFYESMWQSLEREGVWQGEIWDRRKNGEVYPNWLTITAVKGDGGEITHYVSTQINITDRKAAEDEIRYLAFYDPLTRLPNRRLLLDRLRQALLLAMRSQRHGALLFIDLDNFKTLNDSQGHDKGDLLLQEVARRLMSCVRESDTVARLGGDEFVVMLEDLGQKVNEAAAQAENIGNKILAELRQTCVLDGYEYHSTSSVGIALFRDRDETVDELLKQADLAMYQAKAAGRNTIRFFDPQMQAAVTAHIAMERDLRNAVRDDHIVLYYQAQMDHENRLTGAEVLARWQHPQRGMIMPGEFIPLAEETGLILPLGRRILEGACRQLAAWAASPDSAHLSLAVNVSVQQLRQPDFVDQVTGMLELTGANPRRLKLELTESLLMDDVEDTIAKMNALKARGVGFALDDFGTGYSSLAYLKRLPLERLKIDRSFVRDVLVDPNDAAIAKTIVTLAHSLGLAVIAEGVETEQQRDFLASNGCLAYQGFLYSRPLPLREFEAFRMQLAGVSVE
jgi:diguanylate cyclase (GGDEF)-like protein/PAS domain S-box-containing protein